MKKCVEPKKKALFIIILVVVIAILSGGIYGVLQMPKTIAGIMNTKMDVGYEYMTVCKKNIDGEFDIDTIRIHAPEGIEAIWKLMEETDVSFQKIISSTELKEGEVRYEVTDLQHIKSVQITNSGEVYAMALHIPQLVLVYSVSEEQTVSFFERIEEIRNNYGEE